MAEKGQIEEIEKMGPLHAEETLKKRQLKTVKKQYQGKRLVTPSIIVGTALAVMGALFGAVVGGALPAAPTGFADHLAVVPVAALSAALCSLIIGSCRALDDVETTGPVGAVAAVVGGAVAAAAVLGGSIGAAAIAGGAVSAGAVIGAVGSVAIAVTWGAAAVVGFAIGAHAAAVGCTFDFDFGVGASAASSIVVSSTNGVGAAVYLFLYCFG